MKHSFARLIDKRQIKKKSGTFLYTNNNKPEDIIQGKFTIIANYDWNYFGIYLTKNTGALQRSRLEI